jgi:hypothetical protein
LKEEAAARNEPEVANIWGVVSTRRTIEAGFANAGVVVGRCNHTSTAIGTRGGKTRREIRSRRRD